MLPKNIKIKIYRTINLPLVLYGCKTWSLTLRKKRRLRVFENRMLRRIFESMRNEVTGEWRKLRNKKLNDLYCSRNIFRVTKSRRMRWAEHLAGMGERRCICKDLVGNLRERDHLGDLAVDGKIILRWIFRKWDVGWIDLAQDRDRWRAFVNAVMNLRIP